MDTIHNIWIASLAEAYDRPILDTDIRLNRGALERLRQTRGVLTLKIPDQSTMSAFVITRSSACDAGRFVACPMPSRMDLPGDRSEQHPIPKVGRTSAELDFVAVYGLQST